MLRGISLSSFVLSVASLLAGAAVCQADSITADFNTVTGNGLLVTLGLNDHVGDTLTVSGYAGEYNWTETSGATVLGNAGSFSTFCIEISQDINFGGHYGYDLVAPSTAPQPSSFWTPAGGMGAADATLIAELWAAHYVNNPASWSVDGEVTFQFAVWDIVYGNELTIAGYNAGDSVEVAADATNAAGWVTALPKNGSGAQANLIALTSSSSNNPNPNSQDQITMNPNTPSVAPLPATATAGFGLLVGMGGMLVLRRRTTARLSA